LWQREVTLGAAAVTLDQWIDPPAPVEVYAIDERAPDAPAPELDADAIPPPARTFEAVLGAAAGEQGDPIGGEGAWP
jgi:hypothetical protein